MRRFKNWLARKLCPDVFERNNRFNVAYQQYIRWLAEMPDIALTIENMKRDIDGQSLSLMYPASEVGPWEISRLRDHLRAMRRENLVVPNYPATIPERRNNEPS